MIMATMWNQLATRSSGIKSGRISVLAALMMTLSLAPRPSKAQVKPPAHAYTTKHIYSDTADPKADISDALKRGAE